MCLLFPCLQSSIVRQVKFLRLTYHSSLFPKLRTVLAVTGSICLLSYYILSHPIILFLTSSTCPLLHDGAPLEAQTTAGKNGPNSFWKFGLPDASTCSKDFSVHCAWSFELGHQANEALSAFFQAPTTGVLRTPIT